MVYREEKLLEKQISVTNLAFLLLSSTGDFNYKTVKSVILEMKMQNTYMILV